MRRWMILAALLCVVLYGEACQAQGYLTDYATSYRYARVTGRMLAVSVGCDAPLIHDDKHVACRLPATWKDARHESLKDLEGSGVFVIDLVNQEHFGYVVSILPAAHCTREKLAAVLRLPKGTLTQRTLIWAVRVHPERPQSTECECAPELMAHAERHSQAQANSNRQYHNLPVKIANSEIVAESWPWNKNIVTAAVDLVASWRQSPGHWNETKRRHRCCGYDMKSNGKRWYGTGVFKD